MHAFPILDVSGPAQLGTSLSIPSHSLDTTLVFSVSFPFLLLFLLGLDMLFIHNHYGYPTCKAQDGWKDRPG